MQNLKALNGNVVTRIAAAISTMLLCSLGSAWADDDVPASADKPAAEAKAEKKPTDLKPQKDAKSESGEPSVIRASNVNASYKINWLGNNIGDFNIKSTITNRQYTLQASAGISMFFGAVTWHGETNSHGLMTANGPVPQSYSFHYTNGEKHEAIDLRFSQKMVQDIIINPPQHSGGRRVPITSAHLQNVLDPLSAIVMLSQARSIRNNESPCNRKIPIFDGKIRYDLVFSPKGSKPISSIGRLRGTAFICSVRYVPIAGHKVGKEENENSPLSGVEVWMVPILEAGLAVPYYISVPTPAGTAVVTTERFDLEMPQGRHALVN